MATRRGAALPDAPYRRQVFVNCPYDEAYLPLLRALVFTVHACGFSARLAVEGENPGALRLQRILDLIRTCKLGIHDLSRVQLDAVGGLPRFNMPFECGVFVGAREFGRATQRQKGFLLLEADDFRHQRTLSDAAGLDPKVHHNDPAELIACVRTFLSGFIEPRPVGAAGLRALYARFEAEFPATAARLEHEPAELLRLDSFADWRWVAADWLAGQASC